MLGGAHGSLDDGDVVVGGHVPARRELPVRELDEPEHVEKLIGHVGELDLAPEIGGQGQHDESRRHRQIASCRFMASQ